MQIGAFNPTPEQIADIDAMAVASGRTATWQGEFYGFGENPPVPEPEPEQTKRDQLIAAGFTEEQADAILALKEK